MFYNWTDELLTCVWLTTFLLFGLGLHSRKWYTYTLHVHSQYLYTYTLIAFRRRLSLLHTVVSGRTQGRSARILLLFGYEATLFKASSESGVVQFDEPMQATPKRIEGKIVDWETSGVLSVSTVPHSDDASRSFLSEADFCSAQIVATKARSSSSSRAS